VARRKSSGDTMSLFPFMSILVCLIGSLTLMITLMMATQANSDQSEDEVDRYREYTELEADIAAAQSELKDLDDLMQNARALQDQVRKALAEVSATEKQQAEHLQRVDAGSDYAKMLAEANDLRKRIATLEQEPAALKAEIERLEKEVQKRNAGTEEAVVQIRSGGSGVDIDPTFVECAATGLVIHGASEPQRIVGAEIGAQGGEFYKLLERIAGTPKGEVVFLVRPDGVNTYNAARNAARSMYTTNGYAKVGKLPVPSQGNIDLSIFRKP
jgi:uncharacterized protein YlxW (UPF0749 family)